MADFREGTPEELAFLADLVGAGLVIESGVPGVYGFNGTFIDIRDRMGDLVTRQYGRLTAPKSCGFRRCSRRRPLKTRAI